MEKKERNNRKKSAVLVLLLLLLFVVVGGYTYSRYTSTGDVTSTATIAKWAVKIGGANLDTYTTDSPLETTLTLVDNEYVADDVIAPGSKGTYEVEIDPTGSQVAIDYTIKLEEVKGLNPENTQIKVTGAKYTIEGGTEQDATVSTTDGTVTISEDLDSVMANKKVTVKVTIEWVNDETNNTIDTTNGKNGGNVIVTSSITAKQHLASDN